MNVVQSTYAPPRSLALFLGGLVFALYQFWWRGIIANPDWIGKPLPLIIAIGAALVFGYGMAMLWWLIRSTKGQIRETFRPTLGRLIGAVCLALVTPIAVFSYIPWILGGLVPFMINGELAWASLIMLIATTLNYPLSAMIVRHTYERRWLRLCLFCLSFWTAYAGHLLYSGAMVFRL